MKKIIIYILVFVFVFFSSPISVNAEEVDYDTYFLELIQDIQTNEGIYGGATNYLLMDYDAYYILLISQSEFDTYTFTYDGDGVDYTGITGGGWFLISENTELTSSADDWSQMSFNNNNYSLDYYDTNTLTFMNTSGQPLIVNTSVDSEGNFFKSNVPMTYLYCSQEIEGFCKQGSNFEVPEPDPEVEYRDGVLGWLARVVDSILYIPELIVDGIIEGLKSLFIPSDDYFESKLKTIEDRYLAILGFSVEEFEAMLKDFGDEKPIEDVEIDLTIGGNTQKVKILNTEFIIDGVDYFRPYIRGFIVLLMVFFSLNQLLYVVKAHGIYTAGFGNSSGNNSNSN